MSGGRRQPIDVPLRTALAGVAGMWGVIAVVAFVRAVPTVWGVDAERNLAAASAALNGSFGSVPDYLYSPLSAMLTAPALLVPPEVAVVGWLVVKVAILVAGTVIATRGLERPDRVLAGIALVAFLPLLYDLEVGNVTVFVLAAVALVAWNRDRYTNGILLGLLLATAPKPQLIPVLAWMLFTNRKALTGAMATAIVGTLVGIALTGIPAYLTWIATLRAPAYLNAGEVINLAIWPQPKVVVVAALIGSLVAFGVAMRRGYWPGFIAAMCLGLLLAPYTLIYAAGMLPAAAPAAVRAAPRALLVLALAAPAALLLAFPAWVGLLLAVAASASAQAWPGAPQGTPEPVS